jgi:hypothetical protein
VTVLEPAPPDQGETAYVPKYIKSATEHINGKLKRIRRTKVVINGIRDEIVAILEESHPQTVRQVFYVLTVRGKILKVEQEYHRTVVRLLVELREEGKVPFGWIADNTRWQRKPSSFTGIESGLDNFARAYRRDLWASSPVYTEVWCEKDALAGVLYEETKVYDVPLMTSRGYSSLSFVHSAAQAIKAIGKPTRRRTSAPLCVACAGFRCRAPR